MAMLKEIHWQFDEGDSCSPHGISILRYVLTNGSLPCLAVHFNQFSRSIECLGLSVKSPLDYMTISTVQPQQASHSALHFGITIKLMSPNVR